MSRTPLSCLSLLHSAPVVFLDSARCETAPCRSLLFLHPEHIVCVENAAEVRGALERVSALSRTRWVAGFVSYEAGYALEPRLLPLMPARTRHSPPLVWFGAYERPWVFDHAAGAWDRPLPRGARTGRAGAGPALPEPLAQVSREDYLACVRAIKRLIASGDTYQVNLTFDTLLRTGADPLALFARLRLLQPVPYGAYIDTGTTRVLSLSPELFFERCRHQITVRPMKGTSRRGRTAQEDRRMREWLQRDPKNRAENVMIVDLLRNDLGRICRPGSVASGPLFEVETHPSLHQMTSTVRGTLRRGIGLGAVFGALFPCGSVTGAPKIRTMEIIRQLEHGERGVYCGAIGYAEPRGRAVFSVAIRTLQQHGRGRWRYRIGSGVVWDSGAAREWDECLLKAAFLSRNLPALELFESMLWDGRRLTLRAEHLRRMQRSAEELGRPLDRARLQQVFHTIARTLGGRPPHKVRVLQSERGAVRWEAAPLGAAAPGMPHVRVWPEPLDRHELLLRHKTTYRPWYAAAGQAAEREGLFDILFVNGEGDVCEGTRTNVFARIGGRLRTPPVSCGLLPGTLRARMLSRRECVEKVLRVADLRRASAVFCGNSVRGLVRVEVA